MPRQDPPPGPRLRIVLEAGIAIGPGKADLLEAVATTGSISAAGRSLGMSYKRAWSLIETMNGHFGQALVHTSKGGRSHGGAELTETGRQVLTLYRRMEAKAREVTAGDVAALRRLLPVMSD
jgi:molybdate transport system regulatory protein